MTRHCREESSQHGSSGTVKFVVGGSDDRDAGSVGGALTAPVAMNDGAKCFVLSMCMDMNQVGRSALGGVAVPITAWDIRDCVQVCVRNRLLAVLCRASTFLSKKFAIFLPRGSSWTLIHCGT